MVEIWQADAAAPTVGLRAAATRATAGASRFVTVKPRPVDGQAPHLDVSVFARGLLKRVVTRMYFPDEPANAADPLLGGARRERRSTLVAVAEADGSLRFDIRLQGDGETVFFAL